MTTMLTVPAEMVGPLRGGLHSALGEAAQAIDTATMEASRTVAPDLYTDPLARFDRTRALLDLIGWTQTVPAVPVGLELDVHRAALLDALDISLAFADAEAGTVDAEREGRSEPSRQQETIRRTRALHDFATAVRSKT